MVGAGSPRARIVLSPEEGKMVWSVVSACVS